MKIDVNLTGLRPTSVIISGGKFLHLQSGVDWASITQGRSRASLLLSSLKDHLKVAFCCLAFSRCILPTSPCFSQSGCISPSPFPALQCFVLITRWAFSVSPCPGTAQISCWLQRKEVCHFLTLPLILRLQQHSQTPSEKFNEGNDFTPRRCFAGVHSSGKEFVGAYRYSMWEVSAHRKRGTWCFKLLSYYSFEVY